jgi:hypothetical protein
MLSDFPIGTVVKLIGAVSDKLPSLTITDIDADGCYHLTNKNTLVVAAASHKCEEMK